MRNLTEEEKQEIYRLHDNGLTISGIANELNMSRNTVRVWVKRYKTQIVPCRPPPQPPPRPPPRPTRACYVPVRTNENGAGTSRESPSVPSDDMIAFVSHVRARPFLFDARERIASNAETIRRRTASLWDEVSLLMNWSVAECKERWKYLLLEYLERQKRDAADHRGHYGAHLDFIRNVEHILDDDEVFPMDDDSEVTLPADNETEESGDPLADIEPDVTASAASVRERQELQTPKPSNDIIKYEIEEVNDEIQKLKCQCESAQSYFDFFSSIQLDFNELSDCRREAFMKKCLLKLNNLLDQELRLQNTN